MAKTEANGTAGSLAKDTAVIGWFFVKSFYQQLSSNPSKLATLYSKNANVVHDDYNEFLVDEHPRLVEVKATGMDEVEQKIYGSMKASDNYKVMITQVDSVDLQKSGDNETILVTVLGEMAKGDSPAFVFSQTFSLEKVGKAAYNIGHDIFRFVLTGDEKEVLGEDEEPEVEEPETSGDVDTPVVSQGSSIEAETPVTSTESSPGKMKESTENGEDTAKDAAKGAVKGAVKDAAKETAEEDVKEDVKESKEEERVKELKQEEKKDAESVQNEKEVEKEVEKEQIEKEQIGKEQKAQVKKSWASAAASAAPTKPPAQKSSQKSSPAPKNTAKQNSKQASPSPAPTKPNDGFNIVKNRNLKTKSSIVINGVELFPVYIKLGRPNVDEKQLVEALETRFGNVAKCEVKGKIALVDFQTSNSQKTSLEVGLIEFADVKAHIEERIIKPKPKKFQNKKKIPVKTG